ncbi:putative FAD-linked oxidoreductase [Variovorax sp. PBL-H6]|uniref:FAD-binding oxidoreductase n=1 Tax=Variovorax sp. PBL-H6 TaxID=434009 RepID=UPI0013167AAC|nr:FAD-linked oxidase C-terminal domain-containing protein [Variovorax sp. PBL-H6]VTU38285.1 putative FAD-linked oxidoreductase [Variovorax sp. PBL-H6]
MTTTSARPTSAPEPADPRWDRVETARRVQALLPALRQRLGDRVSTAAPVLDHHAGGGEGVPISSRPDAVLFPLDNEEVAFVARQCFEAGVPIVPFGTGTSLEAHVAAVHGGISLDLSRMDRILDVSADSLDCRVQAGVTRLRLNAAVRDQGLFFPIDPGADASLGGMASTRASGTAAVRYGTMRDAVLGLTVVTADGRIVRTGTRARKTAAGLDLTRLFVGSEGVLGIVTELQLRLWGLPETVQAAVCQFADLPAAVRSVITTLQMGIPVARIELLDAVQMGACIAYSKLEGLSPLPTLFIEFHGTPASVREQIELLEQIAADGGGSGFAWAERPEDRSRLWKARHDVTYANLALRPGCRMIGTDACVPIAALVECIEQTLADVADSGLVAPLVGHVGDGNFHLGILFDPKSEDERARAEALAERVALRAIGLGGTCTGEHGIGLHRMHQLVAEHGEGVALMRSIKQALDPKGIMNPGKMFRPEPPTRPGETE